MSDNTWVIADLVRVPIGKWFMKQSDLIKQLRKGGRHLTEKLVKLACFTQLSYLDFVLLGSCRINLSTRRSMLWLARALSRILIGWCACSKVMHPEFVNAHFIVILNYVSVLTIFFQTFLLLVIFLIGHHLTFILACYFTEIPITQYFYW